MLEKIVGIKTLCRQHRKKSLAVLVSLACLLGGSGNAYATITAFLENPGNQAIAGVNLVSGWAFASNQEDVTVRPRIDGVTQDQSVIPCCGPREDVQAAVPGAPLETSFSGLINYSALSPGEHMIGVEISAPGCETVIIERTVTVVRPGDAEFLTHFDLTNASAEIDTMNNRIIVHGVEVVSAEGTAITDLQLAYATNSQSMNIVAASASNNARVRVLHASPDAPAVDVLVDDIVALADVAYLESSGYVQVPAGARNFKVNAAGTNTTVIDVTPTLAVGTDSTVIAIDFLANITPLLLADDNTPPASGNVKVRLVHGAPSAGTVDVYVTAAGAALPSMPTLTFSLGEDSGYLEVPAGDYQVRVTPAGDPTTIAIDTGSLTLSDGQIRTAVAVDNEGGGSPFGVVLLEDLN